MGTFRELSSCSVLLHDYINKMGALVYGFFKKTNHDFFL